MKLPRHLSARDLIQALAAYGYSVTRQKGSHVCLTTRRKGEHHVTIPDHKFFGLERSLEFYVTSPNTSRLAEMLWRKNSSEGNKGGSHQIW